MPFLALSWELWADTLEPLFILYPTLKWSFDFHAFYVPRGRTVDHRPQMRSQEVPCLDDG